MPGENLFMLLVPIYFYYNGHFTFATKNICPRCDLGPADSIIKRNQVFLPLTMVIPRNYPILDKCTDN